MRNKSPLFRLTLGLLIGILIVPAQPAHAQFLGGLVFDARNYALQVQRKLEDAMRYVNMFDTAVRQLTTLRGVLGKAEELVTNQFISKRTMSDIGRLVRTSSELKEQVQAITKTRLNMLKSIDDRLRRGIFDPEADLRDLEDYLKSSIGRRSQDSLANLERLRRMDNTLERMYLELAKLQEKQAKTHLEHQTLKAKLKAIDSLPESERDAASIGSLIQKISSNEALIAHYDAKIEELVSRIEERKKKYQDLLDERAKFAQQVHTTNEAWTKFNDALDELQRTLDKY
jgi:chromosome segregation ATPase